MVISPPVWIPRTAFLATMPEPQARNSSWSEPVSDDVAHRRAGGRARYNRDRKVNAYLRRLREIERWGELLKNGGLGLYEHGAKAAMARELGVHRSTVTRDFQAIFRAWELEICPTCLTPVETARWDRLEEEGRIPKPK
jgi:hypothetical protein